MRPPAVVVDDVHVVYRVYEDLGGGLRQRLRRVGRERVRREVHAVRGVSFVLREGESVAIIGSNGSGKSSLLNALTGLLPLESGSIHVKSRPTLLGVGAALQPSLSGRRNVEIGGLALGMSRAEIAAVMDDIVGFAELEDAIDLPLESYSSGMRARLAFSIATAQIPEILLVDEALAVGDGGFRVRSAERIDEIRDAAGTVVLVSHNMQEVLNSCDRAIWIDAGEVRADGPVDQVVDDYQRAAVRSVDSARRRSETAGEAEPAQRTLERDVVGAPASGPRRFVLNIGPSWTGTQGVQQGLRHASAALAGAGIWVPRVAGDPNHLALPAYASRDAGPIVGVSPDDWDSWRAEFRDDFLASVPVRGHAAASSQHAAAFLEADGISELAELVRSAGFDRFEIEIVVRRQDERLSNRVVELLREGSFLEPAYDEIANSPHYDTRALVRRWRDHPEVDHVHLDWWSVDGGPTPTEAFFAALDVEPPEMERAAQLDVLPQIPFDVYDHVRRIGMALRARNAINAQGARTALAVLGRRFNGGLALPPDVAEAVMARFAEGNREIGQELGPDALRYLEAPTAAQPPGAVDEFELMTELWRYSMSSSS